MFAKVCQQIVGSAGDPTTIQLNWHNSKPTPNDLSLLYPQWWLLWTLIREVSAFSRWGLTETPQLVKVQENKRLEFSSLNEASVLTPSPSSKALESLQKEWEDCQSWRKWMTKVEESSPGMPMWLKPDKNHSIERGGRPEVSALAQELLAHNCWGRGRIFESFFLRVWTWQVNKVG